MRISPRQKLLILPIGLILGVGLTVALTSLAKESELDVDPRVIPYDGTISFEGDRFEGDLDLRFTLTDDAACTFTEEHAAQRVRRGRFSVNLGSVAGDIPECVFDANAVYLQVELKSTGAETYKSLAGRQRIHPMPFAYWASEGSDTQVDGNITAAQDITAGRNAAAGNDLTAAQNISAQGSLDVGGDLKIGNRLFVRGDRITLAQGTARNRGSATSQRALAHSDSGDTLIINQSGDFEGNTLVDSRTTIDGLLTTAGNVAVQGDRVTINNKRALYRNSNNQLFVSPSGEFADVISTPPTRVEDHVLVDDNVRVEGNASTNGTTTLYGSTTSNSLISTSNLIRGQLDLMVETVNVNDTQDSKACDVGYRPISCGLGIPNNANNQDMFGCYLYFDVSSRSGCNFWRRKNGSGAESATGYCNCLKVGG